MSLGAEELNRTVQTASRYRQFIHQEKIITKRVLRTLRDAFGHR